MVKNEWKIASCLTTHIVSYIIIVGCILVSSSVRPASDGAMDVGAIDGEIDGAFNGALDGA